MPPSAYIGNISRCILRAPVYIVCFGSLVGQVMRDEAAMRVNRMSVTCVSREWNKCIYDFYIRTRVEVVAKAPKLQLCLLSARNLWCVWKFEDTMMTVANDACHATTMVTGDAGTNTQRTTRSVCPTPIHRLHLFRFPASEAEIVSSKTKQLHWVSA